MCDGAWSSCLTSQLQQLIESCEKKATVVPKNKITMK